MSIPCPFCLTAYAALLLAFFVDTVPAGGSPVKEKRFPQQPNSRKLPSDSKSP